MARKKGPAPPENPPRTPDLHEDIARKKQQFELQDEITRKKQQVELLELQTNMQMRVRFAYILVGLVTASNVAALFLLFFHGFHFKGFVLSDTVIVAVISATVAELASLFYIILKYLFPEDKNKSDESG